MTKMAKISQWAVLYQVWLEVSMNIIALWLNDWTTQSAIIVSWWYALNFKYLLSLKGQAMLTKDNQ